MKLCYHKLRDDAIVPRKSRESDAGWDLFPPGGEGVVIPARGMVIVGTGLVCWFELNEAELSRLRACGLSWYGRIAERSGLAARGIGIGGGVVDRAYRGVKDELRVVIRSHVDRIVEIEPGRAVAQFVPTIILDVQGLTGVQGEIIEASRGGFGKSDFII